jgi:hypothetical protein
LLNSAWEECPATTVKLILNLGNVRSDGAGKQDRANFYRALLWLYDLYPKTFLKNVGLIGKHSSYKCLLDILVYVFHDSEEMADAIKNQTTKTASSAAATGAAKTPVIKSNDKAALQAPLKAVNITNITAVQDKYAYDTRLSDLAAHQARKKGIREAANKKTRRDAKKDRRIELWKAFAASIGKDLKDLRIQRPYAEYQNQMQ